jgi:hypothetical protein
MKLKINSPKDGEFEILYDDEDYEKVSKYNWFIDKHKGDSFYVRAFIYKNGKCSCLRIHRLITNCTKDKMVDHINGDTLDNRKCNLRVCSNQENSMNSKSYKNSSSNFKGVTWHKKANKWAASIMKDYKTIYLGLFENEMDAALVYNGAAKYLFKEFACLNGVSL